MLRPWPLRSSALVRLAFVVALGSFGLSWPAPEAAAQERPDCANFLDQEDAQVAFDAEPADPFGLDEPGAGDGVACQQPADGFGASPLVGCDDLRAYPGIARALYDHALRKYGDDRYALAAFAEQTGTDAAPAGSADRTAGNGGRDQARPDGTRVVVSAVPLGTGATLEARLEARFAALEARFAAFAARAENGFGAFAVTDGDASNRGSARTVVTTSSSTSPAATQTGSQDENATATRAKKARHTEKDEPGRTRAEGARKDERGANSKEHKGKHK